MIRKTVTLGFFLALALILAYVESLIPFSFGIPGIKLGLPNLIVVLLLYRNDAARMAQTVQSHTAQNAQKGRDIAVSGSQTDHDITMSGNQTEYNGLLQDSQTASGGIRDALLVNGLRIVLSGFLFSNLYAILYALAGALCSFAAMLLGRRLKCLSVIGVSVLGGVFHNIGQIIVAMLVVETVYVGYYIPFLIVSGTVTGAVLGVAAMELMPYLQRNCGV